MAGVYEDEWQQYGFELSPQMIAFLGKCIKSISESLSTNENFDGNLKRLGLEDVFEGVKADIIEQAGIPYFDLRENTEGRGISKFYDEALARLARPTFLAQLKEISSYFQGLSDGSRGTPLMYKLILRETLDSHEGYNYKKGEDLNLRLMETHIADRFKHLRRDLKSLIDAVNVQAALKDHCPLAEAKDDEIVEQKNEQERDEGTHDFADFIAKLADSHRKI